MIKKLSTSQQMVDPRDNQNDSQHPANANQAVANQVDQDELNDKAGSRLPTPLSEDQTRTEPV